MNVNDLILVMPSAVLTALSKQASDAELRTILSQTHSDPDAVNDFIILYRDLYRESQGDAA